MQAIIYEKGAANCSYPAHYLLAGARAAANGQTVYSEGRFHPGMALLALILPLRSMIGMQQRRRTTLLLSRYATQAHSQELAIDR